MHSIVTPAWALGANPDAIERNRRHDAELEELARTRPELSPGERYRLATRAVGLEQKTA